MQNPQPGGGDAKNGRKALRGVAGDDSKTVVMRMMSPEAIRAFQEAGA